LGRPVKEISNRCIGDGDRLRLAFVEKHRVLEAALVVRPTAAMLQSTACWKLRRLGHVPPSLFSDTRLTAKMSGDTIRLNVSTK
jgi:hypothetical protein